MGSRTHGILRVAVAVLLVVLWLSPQGSAVAHDVVEREEATDAGVPDSEVAALRERSVSDLSPSEVLKAYEDQVRVISESLSLSDLSAANLMRLAEPAAHAWTYLHGSLGPDFGGAWFDWRDGTPKLVVGVVGGKEATDDRVAEALSNSGVPFATTTTIYSYDELIAKRDDVVSQLRAADEAAALDKEVEPLLAVVNEEYNRIDVVVPDDASIALTILTDPMIRVTSGPRPASEVLLGGGWGTAACGFAYPVTSLLNSSRSLLTAGHCWEPSDQPTYQGPGGPITLGTQEFDSGTQAAYSSGLDREFHAVPAPHSTTTQLTLLDHQGNATGTEIVNRGFGGRLVANTVVMFYGVSGIRNCRNGTSDWRDPIELFVFTGMDPQGRLVASAASPLEGGGIDTIGGDSGGPLWLGNMALGTLRGGFEPPAGADPCQFYSGAYSLFNRVDAQLTDIGTQTISYMLQEGNGPDFRSGGVFIPVTPFRILDTRNGGGPISAATARDVDFTPPLTTTAGAVVLNIAAIPVSGQGVVSAYPPLGSGFYVGSNAWAVEFNGGLDTVSSSSLVVRINSDGVARFKVDGGSGTTHLIVDVLGYVQRNLGIYAAGFEYDSIPNPTRVYDSRNDASLGKLGTGITRSVTIPSACGATPALNITALDATQPTFLSVFSTGTPRPDPYSNVNISPGDATARLVTVPVGTGNRVSVYNAFGSVHFILDLVGCYKTDYPSADSHNDGRSVFGGQHPRPSVSIAAGTTISRDLLGDNFPFGPYQGVEAVYLSVDATTDGLGFLQFWRPGTTTPPTSSLNIENGRWETNAVIAPVNSAGEVSIGYNGSGTATVQVTIQGWVLS